MLRGTMASPGTPRPASRWGGPANEQAGRDPGRRSMWDIVPRRSILYRRRSGTGTLGEDHGGSVAAMPRRPPFWLS